MDRHVHCIFYFLSAICIDKVLGKSRHTKKGLPHCTFDFCDGIRDREVTGPLQYVQNR